MPYIIRPVGAPSADGPKLSLFRRLSWFAALSFGGVLVTACVAYGLHALLQLR